MSNASKSKGSRWEHDLREYFRNQGLDVEMLRQLGANDEGDMVIRAGSGVLRFVVEAKNTRQITLPRFLSEAKVEADLYSANRGLEGEACAFPVTVVKARQRAASEAFCVMRAEDFSRLLGIL